MAPAFLLLTDDKPRSQRLVRDLGGVGTFTLRNIFDGPSAAVHAAFQAVLSDVDLTRSDTLMPLRRHLSEARKGGVPFLCLLRSDTARANIQATALGATRVLTLGASLAPLIAALSGIVEPGPGAPVAAQLSQVRATIARMLSREDAPAPEAAEATTGLVLEILSEVGVSECSIWSGASTT